MTAYCRTPRFFFLLIVFFIAHNLSALDLQITGKEAGLDFRVEYNRALLYSIDYLSSFAGVELNNRYAFKSGFSLGDTGGGFDIKLFTQGKIGPLFRVPLHFTLAYLYNGLPGYETHIHTILPLASLNGRWVGITTGPGLRFTGFFGESPVFESMLSFSAYVNFINNNLLRIGLRWANFSDFFAGNMGSYSLCLNSLVRVSKQWAIINDLELLQSGSVALAANFYGLAYRGGVRVSW